MRDHLTDYHFDAQGSFLIPCWRCASRALVTATLHMNGIRHLLRFNEPRAAMDPPPAASSGGYIIDTVYDAWLDSLRCAVLPTPPVGSFVSIEVQSHGHRTAGKAQSGNAASGAYPGGAGGGTLAPFHPWVVPIYTAASGSNASRPGVANPPNNAGLLPPLTPEALARMVKAYRAAQDEAEATPPPLIETEFVAGEIIGYRMWRMVGVTYGGPRLLACFNDVTWQPGVMKMEDARKAGSFLNFAGSIIREHPPGIYAWKSPARAKAEFDNGLFERPLFSRAKAVAGYSLDGGEVRVATALGSVRLWGEVFEHTHGYRAEYARVNSLDAIWPADDALLADLRKAYDCEAGA